MLLIQIILVLFAILAGLKTVFRYRAKEILGAEALLWVVFWTGVLVVAIKPETTTDLAKILGVGRGADLVIYFSFLVLFYLVFRIFIRLHKIEKEITKIVRKEALEKENK